MSLPDSEAAVALQLLKMIRKLEREAGIEREQNVAPRIEVLNLFAECYAAAVGSRERAAASDWLN